MSKKKKKPYNTRSKDKFAMPVDVKLWARITQMAARNYPEYPDEESVNWASSFYISRGGRWR